MAFNNGHEKPKELSALLSEVQHTIKQQLFQPVTAQNAPSLIQKYEAIAEEIVTDLTQVAYFVYITFLMMLNLYSNEKFKEETEIAKQEKNKYRLIIEKRLADFANFLKVQDPINIEGLKPEQYTLVARLKSLWATAQTQVQQSFGGFIVGIASYSPTQCPLDISVDPNELGLRMSFVTRITQKLKDSGRNFYDNAINYALSFRSDNLHTTKLTTLEELNNLADVSKNEVSKNGLRNLYFLFKQLSAASNKLVEQVDGMKDQVVKQLLARIIENLEKLENSAEITELNQGIDEINEDLFLLHFIGNAFYQGEQGENILARLITIKSNKAHSQNELHQKFTNAQLTFIKNELFAVSKKLLKPKLQALFNSLLSKLEEIFSKKKHPPAMLHHADDLKKFLQKNGFTILQSVEVRKKLAALIKNSAASDKTSLEEFNKNLIALSDETPDNMVIDGDKLIDKNLDELTELLKNKDFQEFSEIRNKLQQLSDEMNKFGLSNKKPLLKKSNKFATLSKLNKTYKKTLKENESSKAKDSEKAKIITHVAVNKVAKAQSYLAKQGTYADIDKIVEVTTALQGSTENNPVIKHENGKIVMFDEIYDIPTQQAIDTITLPNLSIGFIPSEAMLNSYGDRIKLQLRNTTFTQSSTKRRGSFSAEFFKYLDPTKEFFTIHTIIEQVLKHYKKERDNETGEYFGVSFLQAGFKSKTAKIAAVVKLLEILEVIKNRIEIRPQELSPNISNNNTPLTGTPQSTPGTSYKMLSHLQKDPDVEMKQQQEEQVISPRNDRLFSPRVCIVLPELNENDLTFTLTKDQINSFLDGRLKTDYLADLWQKLPTVIRKQFMSHIFPYYVPSDHGQPATIKISFLSSIFTKPEILNTLYKKLYDCLLGAEITLDSNEVSLMKRGNLKNFTKEYFGFLPIEVQQQIDPQRAQDLAAAGTFARVKVIH